MRAQQVANSSGCFVPRPYLVLLKQRVAYHWPPTVLFQHVIERLDGDGFLHVCGKCSAFRCGSHDRWP